MVSSGADSNADVHPILVDADGRPYVILDDGAGNTMPAGDDITRPVIVKVTDGVTIWDIDNVNRGVVAVSTARPDGANLMPSGDATARPIYVKLTDGSDDAIVETDDDDITGGQKTLVVINLNYVWDAGNTKWVRMTQP